jgi:uncharacterized protein
MDNNRIITATAHHIRQKFEGEGSGHDWWHIYRVWNTATRIGEEEGADTFVVQLAALLHDIADWKFHDGDDDAGPRQARQWLEGLEVTEPVISRVCTIIKELSFKGAGVPTPMSTLEGQVVQDADRLDAIGAIGIARAFAYGGHKNRALYDPDIPPTLHDSFASYKSSQGTTVNHFYEKLLLLKDRMNTPAARRMAEQRHAFMEEFLQRFFQEWEG